MAVGQTNGLHNEVYRDHRKHTGEHSQYHRKTDHSLTSRETHTAECVTHHQDKRRRDRTAEYRNDQRIQEPSAVLQNGIRLKQYTCKIGKRPFFREETRITDARIGTECRNDQPEDRDQPERCQKCQQHILKYAEDQFFFLHTHAAFRFTVHAHLTFCCRLFPHRFYTVLVKGSAKSLLLSIFFFLRNQFGYFP